MYSSVKVAMICPKGSLVFGLFEPKRKSAQRMLRVFISICGPSCQCCCFAIDLVGGPDSIVGTWTKTDSVVHCARWSTSRFGQGPEWWKIDCHWRSPAWKRRSLAGGIQLACAARLPIAGMALRQVHVRGLRCFLTGSQGSVMELCCCCTILSTRSSWSTIKKIGLHA